MPKFVLSTAAALALAAAAATAQTTQTVVFEFPDGPLDGYAVEMLFGWFGEDADGGQIVESRLYLTFETGGGFDAADLHTQFVVPTLGGQEVWELTGADMGWSGQGTFEYVEITDAFNGEVRPGKYSWILDAGEFQGISGQFLAGSRYEFDVVGAQACYADFDGNGSLDLFDFLAFVNAFNTAAPAADCDASGALSLFDFLCFTNAFNAGC